MRQRKKLSTTIGAENYVFLNRLVKTGKARSVGEAVDWAVERARRAENRQRLEQDTAAYFARLSSQAAAEEALIDEALDQAAMEVDLEQP